MDGERIKQKYPSVKTTFPITMVGAWFCRYVTQGKTFLQLFSHQPKHIYTVLKLVQNQILALHIIFDREPKFKSSYLQISYGRLAFHIILNSWHPHQRPLILVNVAMHSNLLALLDFVIYICNMILWWYILYINAKWQGKNDLCQNKTKKTHRHTPWIVEQYSTILLGQNPQLTKFTL